MLSLLIIVFHAIIFDAHKSSIIIDIIDTIAVFDDSFSLTHLHVLSFSSLLIIFQACQSSKHHAWRAGRNA